ncbi:MAG TPA: class I SAM-dependent methyltransferase [Ideonella sp.]|nr:class I SAM-dependent methyltransferase [Ideonella sp.]
MSRPRQIYRAEQLPVFQNRMFATAEAARRCARGDVVLVQDEQTGLIFNQAFDPACMQYDADYQNEQGHSSVFRAHLEQVGRIVQAHFGERTLIEVGCGKGQFLEQLQALGFSVTGMDPAYEGSNPAIVREYFSPAAGRRAGGLVLRHVLEHVQDPLSFLERLRDTNGGSGLIYIEVPCTDWIADHHAWFDLFYEHVNYFRLGDFGRLFGEVVASGRLFGGQYLYAVAELASLRAPRARSTDRFDFPADFRASLDAAATALRQRPAGGQAAVWGGASKGVIFTLMMQRAGAAVDLVVDINPAKQGRYLAATGLRVHSPEEALRALAPGADLFVMNRNYLPEIEQQTGGRFNCIPIERAAAVA